MTVLEKCGLSQRVTDRLKRRGLVITGNTKPFPNFLKSPGDDWVVYTMDSFTPALSDAERQMYVESPEQFCEDLLSNLAIFGELCRELYEATQRFGTLSDEEAIAACFSGLLVFQSAMDSHYYKYDRHLEYHEHKESPVGFHWLRIKEFCKAAGRLAGMEDAESWGRERALRILAAVGRETVSSRFLSASFRTFRWLTDVVSDLEKLDCEIAVGRLRKENPDAFRRLKATAAVFRRSPEEFLGDSLRSAALRIGEKLKERPQAGLSLVEEVHKLLASDEAVRFEFSVEAMRLFQQVQEQETYKFYGLVPRSQVHNIDAGLAIWGELNRRLAKGSQSIVPRYRPKVEALLQGNPIVGTRDLLATTPGCLNQSTRLLYHEETRRWLQ